MLLKGIDVYKKELVDKLEAYDTVFNQLDSN